MSTLTSRSAPSGPGPRGAVIRLLVQQSATWLAGFWLVVAAAMTAVGLAWATWGDPIENSIWEMAGTAPRWALFVGGLFLTTAYLPVLVGHGVTRRDFAVATYLATAVLAVGMAVVMQVGYLLERAVFTAADLPQGLDRPHLFHDATQAHLVLPEYALAFAAYLVSGWLLGTAYYRLGGWLGTLSIPLALLPAILVEVILATGWMGVGLDTLRVGGTKAPVAIIASLAVIASAMLANRMATRATPIKSKTA